MSKRNQIWLSGDKIWKYHWCCKPERVIRTGSVCGSMMVSYPTINLINKVCSSCAENHKYRRLSFFVDNTTNQSLRNIYNLASNLPIQFFVNETTLSGRNDKQNSLFMQKFAMLSSLLSIFSGNSRTAHSTNVESTRVDRVECPLLCLLPEDVMGKQVLPLLMFKDVVRLESVFANLHLRNDYYYSLKGLKLCGVVDFRHLNCCISRKCSARTLRITTHVDDKSTIICTSPFKELHLCATAKVSKDILHSILMSARDLEILNIQHFYCKPSGDLLSQKCTNLPLLEIDVSGNNYLHEDILIEIVELCPLLRIINTNRSSRFTRKLPRALGVSCPDLRKICMKTYRIATQNYSTGYCELFVRCRLLQEVEISGMFNVSNLRTLAINCSQLKSVVLCFRSTTNWNEALVATANAALTALVQNNPLIHTLALSHVNYINEATLQAVAMSLPLLCSFSLCCCAASLPGLTSIRTHCAQLTTFQCYLSSEAVPRIFDYLQLCILTTLQINASTLLDAQLVQLARANPHLRRLFVCPFMPAYVNPFLSPSALCAALSHWRQLTEFSIEVSKTSHSPNHHFSGIMQINDDVLYVLVRHCAQLTSININQRENLSNDAISALSQLPFLRVLSAAGCEELLDSGVTAIAEGCPLLEAVNLSFCSLLSNLSVNALARCCKHLTSVNLRRCTSIQDSSIQNMIRHARHLQKLDLALIPQLSFAAVAELPRYCLGMRYLRLYSHFWDGHQDALSRPLMLEFCSSYRSNKHYFDVIFGWSEEGRYE